MKKIQIILLILLVSLTYSCDDDGGTSVIDLGNDGAVPNMLKSETGDSFIDLVKVTNGENVTVSFSADIAQGTPATTDIVGSYKTVDGEIYNAVLFGNVSLPQDFDLTVDDIVAAFSELNAPTDLLLGDVLTLTTSFTMDDGVVLNILNEDGSSNLNSNLTNSALFTTVVNYPVSCPSDIGGVYNVISNGDNTDGQPPAVDLPYTITLTDNGGGNYTISDGVAGVYIFWYSIYGYTFETEGNFTDICGTLSGTWTEAFGCWVDLTGTVNADGTLTIQWNNCFGDHIDEAIYTPQ